MSVCVWVRFFEMVSFKPVNHEPNRRKTTVRLEQLREHLKREISKLNVT